ncbi:SDR family oxidoreductase [Methylibium sp.]|uniref:SDR family oxidoreductase n=1 Tax=Methylibium sp. TaxID=2067992 RepID=UPI003D12E2C8
MIAVTGATGQLGRLVLEELLKTRAPESIAALVRSPDKARDLAARGLQVREADYSRPSTLEAALKGVDRLLLISSSEIGQRVDQHRAVIDAARHAGVQLLVYTSLLHADSSALGLAGEHRETEALVQSSGLPFVILRNGWYTENYTAAVPAALAHGALLGSAREGRIASAARADYAAAAAAVLRDGAETGRVYELAGDTAYSLTELAAEISRLSGKAVRYQDLPPSDYKAALLGAGLPEGLAALLADSDAGASQGALFDDGKQLSQLIGRPTTPLATLITVALPRQ